MQFDQEAIVRETDPGFYVVSVGNMLKPLPGEVFNGGYIKNIEPSKQANAEELFNSRLPKAA